LNNEEIKRIAEVLSGPFAIGKWAEPLIMKVGKNAKRNGNIRKQKRKTTEEEERQKEKEKKE